MDPSAIHRISRDEQSRWVLSVWNDRLGCWEPALVFDSREALGEATRDLGGFVFSEAKREFERAYAERVLRKTRGDVTRAALLAGKHRSDFHKLVRRAGVDVDAIRRETRSR